MGAKRLGYGGETTRVENRDETTRVETSWGKTSCYQVYGSMQRKKENGTLLIAGKFTSKQKNKLDLAENLVHINLYI